MMFPFFHLNLTLSKGSNNRLRLATKTPLHDHIPPESFAMISHRKKSEVHSTLSHSNFLEGRKIFELQKVRSTESLNHTKFEL